MAPLSERRWYNPRLPQTLVISQWLLYFNAFWALLAVFTGGVMGSAIGAVLLLASLGANVYGAYGIANELKLGYQVAVVAAFLPFVLRLVIVFISGASLMRNIGFVLVPGDIINAIFVYALVALLLHPQSREHQKIWFS
ncbi:MAG TPA: hypothetical protein P5193_06450 [Microthrixaceae bacterium]|nr:hypothetical protein [Microthrixaceae bacterium]RTL05808.1 MAG: hypothetical protein EKK62_13830 [Acidimicrobiia bacterium]HMZ02555.1 hypothetical protein [Burkholderiaceae bacterium]MCB9375365.1 hypothetical protein [Microthrixaceae bacterium]MCB9400252.1 hypothetical protein [Microthrixaceae bacterium]